ncbi:MAG: electron transfer flavoprotein subunit beta/FixA family protein [Dehalococcoidia bacterium]
MDIVVAIKQVPDTSEAVDVVEIDASGKYIKKETLVSKINDWDEYALEEAVQLKQKLGGTVTALTVGPSEWDDILRRSLAMGADLAIRIDEDAAAMDCYTVARILAASINRLSHDLIMLGAQSEDFGSGQLGCMVAEMLGIPHASLVVSLQVEEEEARVSRELEGGVLELYTLKLPALFTIQTGINRPRYVSFASIKKAREKELKVMSLNELGLNREALTPMVRLEKLELTPTGKKAELISGSTEEAAGKLAMILKDTGVI